MRAGRNEITGESEIYLDWQEALLMKEMIQGAALPIKRVFHKILESI